MIYDRLMLMRWLLLIAASSATMFAQLATPNASGIAYGHVHMFVNDPDAEKKIWVDLLGARNQYRSASVDERAGRHGHRF
jgi:catechol-2,3-dioxygenase